MLTHRAMLERAADWQPDEIALVDVPGDRTYTYAEFDAEANRVGDALRARGIRTGDRVAMVLYNTVEFPLTLYGIYKAGAVPVPLNYMLAEDNFTYIFDDMHPAALVYDADVATPVEAAIDAATSSPHRVRVGTEPDGGESFEALRTSGDPGRPPERPRNSDDLAYMLYTSGTTGAPKGVAFSIETAFDRVREAVLQLELSPTSVLLQVSPWFHAGGIGLTVQPGIMAGATLLVTHDWDPELVADLVEEHSLTHVVGVPTVAQRMARMDDIDQRDFDSLECLLCMGSPLSERLATTLMEHITPNVYNGYGTTETLLDTLLRPSSLPEHAGTVGRPSPDKQVRVVAFDQSDRAADPHDTVAVGERGEVITRGGPLLDYYFEDQAKTDAALRNGWFYTGDLGVKNQDGYLTITGRVDDMIISGGELVSPVEVEDTLEEHDDVVAAVVVGKPDEDLGEQVTAVVAADDAVTAADLDAFCREHTGLANYKRPRSYQFVDEIERTATGKKQRYRYR